MTLIIAREVCACARETSLARYLNWRLESWFAPLSLETLEAGHDIDELISHGLDLVSSLLPKSATGEELRQFIGQMARHFVTSSHSSLLFLIKVRGREGGRETEGCRTAFCL